MNKEEYKTLEAITRLDNNLQSEITIRREKIKILEAEKGKKGKIYANEDALKRNRIYFREEK